LGEGEGLGEENIGQPSGLGKGGGEKGNQDNVPRGRGEGNSRRPEAKED